MKTVEYSQSFRDSWRFSYNNDLIEIYGSNNHSGHYYTYINRFRNVFHLVSKYIKPKAKILDIAAAQGNFTLCFAELGYDVIWNDIREDLVGYVKKKYERGNVEFVPKNIFECSFNYQFDFVLVGEFIEHTAHPDRLLGHIASFVKKGGYILITTPNGEYFRNKLMKFSEFRDPSLFEDIQFKPGGEGHIFGLCLSEFYMFARPCGLSITEIRIINNPLTSGHVKLGLLLKFLPKYFIEILEIFTNSLPLFIKRRINSNLILLLKKN